MNKHRIIMRVLVLPFVFMIILINYIFHVFRNSFMFLKYGGEWITYAKNERKTIQDFYELIAKP